MTDLGGHAVVAVAGLAVGSFLNVCIHRLPVGMSVVRPASHCPGCGVGIRWFDNIPVLSFLWLRGRCRACDRSISPVYPLVELATAGVFVLLYRQIGWEPLLAIRLLFASAMVALFMIDLQHRILPNMITLPGIVIGLAAAVGFEPGWRAALTGVVVGGGGLFLLAEAYYRVRHQEGLGMGDVKMLAMIGAFLGWQLMLVTLLLASLLGSVIGIAMLALGLSDAKYALPFGTFLALGAVVAALAGEPLVVWYGDLYTVPR